jgi:tRNA A-37 threonylcarbamoyl transferase component Bud32
MPLKDGEDFAGFTVLRLLGSGGMGNVYLAEHPRLPRLEALKVLRPDVSSDADFRERFIREADLASSLWHPNLVAVHDRGECDGQLWMSMDYVDGADCGKLLAERQVAGMPARWVSEIVTSVADALDDAHRHGLLHRDIKPSNIMITNPDEQGVTRALLTDFGIARNVDDVTGLTVTSMTVGTVAYSAPEQLMGNTMDGRSDQYALAATAYHLLTGVPLFPNVNAVAVISAHLTATPPRISLLRRELAALDEVLLRALAKDPGQRFASCIDFAEAMREKIPGWPAELMPKGVAGPASLIESRMPASPRKGFGRAAKRPVLMAFSLLTAVALVALVATFAANKIENTAGRGGTRYPDTAQMVAERYLQALAAGDARTALSFSAAQPVNTRLLTDQVLRRQLAGTPITNIAVQYAPATDHGQTDEAQRIVMSANFGPTPSRTVIGLHKVQGQWKLDATTVTVAIGDPTSGNESLKAVAISGVPTEGASPIAVFPGTPLVSSANRYLDISAETQPLLLEALTDTAAHPAIQPTATVNDAGRQAIKATLDARGHYCYSGGRVAPPDCCPCLTHSVDGRPFKLETIQVVRLEDSVNMKYELDPSRMLVHVTGVMQYTFSGEATTGPQGPSDFELNQTVNSLVDIAKDPPVYVGRA